MAITNLEVPQVLTPAFNDQVIQLERDGGVDSLFKYKYVLDVTVLNAFTSDNDQYLGRFKCLPLYEDPGASGPTIGFFNLKEFVKRALYLGTYNTGLVYPIVGVKVEVGEEYSTTASGAAVYHAVTGNNYQYAAFNGSFDINDFVKYDHTDYLNIANASAGSGIAFYALTTYTGVRKTLVSTYQELLFPYAGVYDLYAKFTYYNGDTLISTEDKSISETIFGFKIDASAYGLVIPPTCTRYTVQGFRLAGNAITPIYEYEFANFDCEYDLINIYFQSKYGAVESYVAERKSFKTTTTQRELMKNNDRYIASYSINNPATQVYNSELKNRHVVNTEYIENDSSLYSLLSELVLTNRAGISFDKESVFIAGVKASMRLTFPWESEGVTPGEISFSADTALGNRSFVVDAGTGYQTFADDFITNVIIPILEESDFNDDYVFSAEFATASEAIVLITAKTVGASKSFTGFDIEGGVVVTNNIAGVNNVSIPGSTIPVIVENETYKWTKHENNELFQLSLNLLETSTFERQYK
jgi:hypothetical protein